MPAPIHSPWLTDNDFLALMTKIQGRTLVDPVRCFMLWQFARVQALRPVPQLHEAEVGVYKGGTAYVLASTLLLPHDRIDLFDTFSGMPPCDPKRDLHKEGNFKDCSLQDVQKFLDPFVVSRKVQFHPGFFPATAQAVATGRFNLVHVDCDIYRSVMDCCIFFAPRMEDEGIIIFDDYGFPSCPGAKQAVDEYFGDKAIYLPTGQCYVQF